MTGTSGEEDQRHRKASHGAEHEGGQLNSGGSKNKTQRERGSTAGGTRRRSR